jgi:hypothetical protein
MPTKVSYKQAKNKKLWRYKIFDFYRNTKTIIGLGGPDLKDYIEFLESKGFSDIRIWEKDRNIILKQIPQLKALGGRVKTSFGDILRAPVIKDAIYDLDFNQSIAYVGEHLKKFKKNRTVLTVALRPYTLEATVRLFLSYRNEFIKRYQYNDKTKEGSIISNKGRTYGMVTYHDSSVNMVTIYSIS